MAARTDPPDRLALVLDEVDRARREARWLPQDPQDRRRRWERAPSADRTGRSARGASHDVDNLTEGDKAHVLTEAGEHGGPGYRHAASRRSVRPAELPMTRRERRAATALDDGRADDRLGGLRPSTPLVRPRRTLAEVVVAPGRAAVLGLVVMLVAVSLVLGGRLAWMRATSAPEPIAAPTGATAGTAAGAPNNDSDDHPDDSSRGSGRSRAGEPAGAGASGRTATPAAAGPEAQAAPAATVYVHVVGQVRRPGVVSVPAAARVRDAVAAAGGALQGADLGALNLARPVADGEQVRVPKPGEEVAPQTPPAAAAGTTGPISPGGSSSVPGVAPSGAAGPVDLNAADLAALDALPGIGPVLAQRIIQFRTENGPFSAVEELGEVSGIGDRVLERLRPLVTV